MKKPKVFYEYQKITSDDLSESDFKELKSFILKQEEDGANNCVPFDELKIEDSSACMKLSSNKQGREILTVKNHVGTILLSSGTVIEILPKIYQNGNKDEDTVKNSARTLVFEMLKTCGLIKSKSFQSANLNLEKLPIFEVYIRLFLNNVFELYQKGLKSGYVQKQENERFFKGKLLFSKHIKYNFAHAERFYIEYDEFNVNRPENKLIKTTISFLRNITQEEINKRDLRRLSMIFEDVEKSESIDSDFAKCTGGRNMKEYANILDMCKVFLKGYTFSSFSGKNNTTALLFPMERLFEGYVAKKIQERLVSYTVSTQKRGTFLFDKFSQTEDYTSWQPETNRKMFALRPDIFVLKDNGVILLDTKWKVLSEDSNKNFDISSDDMYQMHAYYSRFSNVKSVILLYPSLDGKEKWFKWTNGNEEIYAVTLEINKKDEFLSNLIALIKEK